MGAPVWCLLVLLTLSFLVLRTTATPEDDWVMISRCRAGCLAAAVEPSSGDGNEEPGEEKEEEEEGCGGDQQCNMCWSVCERLLVDSLSWAPVCERMNQPSMCVSLHNHLYTRLTPAYTKQIELPRK